MDFLGGFGSGLQAFGWIFEEELRMEGRRDDFQPWSDEGRLQTSQGALKEALKEATQ